MFFFCSFITFILAASIVSKNTTIDREKSSPFECGFDPNGSARIPFSLHFFLIAVIFLVFDVEITLLLPLVSISNFSDFFLLDNSAFIFNNSIVWALFWMMFSSPWMVFLGL